MPELSFSILVIVVAVAFLAPLVLGLIPRLRLPSTVVEIVLRIVIGPSVLGWSNWTRRSCAGDRFTPLR